MTIDAGGHQGILTWQHFEKEEKFNFHNQEMVNIFTVCYFVGGANIL